jgi:hypothetical protein
MSTIMSTSVRPAPSSVYRFSPQPRGTRCGPVKNSDTCWARFLASPDTGSSHWLASVTSSLVPVGQWGIPSDFSCVWSPVSSHSGSGVMVLERRGVLPQAANSTYRSILANIPLFYGLEGDSHITGRFCDGRTVKISDNPRQAATLCQPLVEAGKQHRRASVVTNSLSGFFTLLSVSRNRWATC